ncbi:DUF1631 family protein [Variovorax sp. WS11]|uniref:DUF1631 family protein n=1 Tax=Variovorax sp. WS11 TaxID=1105204 RepID=UPI0023B266EC|nr:DUF1631 family protein [Variovorax sp. WS11]
MGPGAGHRPAAPGRGGRRSLQGCQCLPDRARGDARDRPQELCQAHRQRQFGASGAGRQLRARLAGRHHPARRRRRGPRHAGRLRRAAGQFCASGDRRRPRAGPGGRRHPGRHRRLPAGVGTPARPGRAAQSQALRDGPDRRRPEALLAGACPAAAARAEKKNWFGGGGFFQSASGAPAFAAAIADAEAAYQVMASQYVVGDEATAIHQTAAELRRRTSELKKKAPTTADKATVEIVALMFQAILAEERIPFSARVWFARLQMPVLRVAIAEPEFFGTLQHPARMLIDRMGSCVMGFDAAAISGSALEGEIRRVVQVIEQYPETGQRVFKLVFDEFVAFLNKYLTQSDATQRLMSVAQQVEQKETMAIQYTIELRKMLNDMPVREEIREFLFKIWAEVLAIAALRYGAQDEQTVTLKRAASDLVWAASAKPNRNDRARVIQDLPQLLQRLRQGMSLLGIEGEPQEAQIKTIGSTLSDAFLSKTEAIPPAKIEAMAKRLANLEDFVTDEGDATDLPLDAASIELLLGVDAASLEIVPDTGNKVGEDMLQWAHELQVGTWFMLDHNDRVSQVQFVWRSERKQLHLFASSDGRSFLIQVGRLASYLQAGLLVPAEEETLTVRATREALAKLDANPERLLN